MLARLAGAVVGTLAAHTMFGPLVELSQHVRTGSAHWLAEAVAAFGLVAVVLGGLHTHRAAVRWPSASTSPPPVGSPRQPHSANRQLRSLALTDTCRAFVIAQIAGALVASVATSWRWRRAEPGE